MFALLDQNQTKSVQLFRNLILVIPEGIQMINVFFDSILHTIVKYLLVKRAYAFHLF